MSPRARLYLAGASLLVSALGCSAWLPDLVEQHRFRAPGPLRKLAVAPFEASPRPSNRALGAGVEFNEAATLVSRFVTEALEARGLEVVPPHDLQVAFEADLLGQDIGRLFEISFERQLGWSRPVTVANDGVMALHYFLLALADSNEVF